MGADYKAKLSGSFDDTANADMTDEQKLEKLYV